MFGDWADIVVDRGAACWMSADALGARPPDMAEP